ncbi:MAG: protein rep [Candidatus Eisenbacteria sp.]|nr:protein rep [Candidatus Eisenbacteria bacterium]
MTPGLAGVSHGPDCSLDPLQTWNSSINFRHSGWNHDRRRVYEALRRTGQSGGRLHDFTGCGKHAFVFRSVEDPEVYTLGGSTCHDRFCLPCGRERSRIIAGNVKERIAGEPARFLTLTLRSDAEPLAELLAKLTHDFCALRRTKLWRKRVTGGVAFLEVKWLAGTNRWHVHLHALLQGKYVPREEISTLWLKITGTSDVIDIRIVEDEAHCTHYICKYASKPLDRTVVVVPLRLDEAIEALKGKRLCMTFGSWRGYKLTEPPESGTWIQLGTLDEIITRAEDGDADAQHALDVLRVEYAPCTRAPPASTVATVSTLTLDQPCFSYLPDPEHGSGVCGTRFVKGE